MYLQISVAVAGIMTLPTSSRSFLTDRALDSVKKTTADVEFLPGLVKVQKIMENHHAINGKSPCSIALLNYERVWFFQYLSRNYWWYSWNTDRLFIATEADKLKAMDGDCHFFQTSFWIFWLFPSHAPPCALFFFGFTWSIGWQKKRTSRSTQCSYPMLPLLNLAMEITHVFWWFRMIDLVRHAFPSSLRQLFRW